MAKYTSDTNLIRGAAAAYKDWSNMPGMYEGLDKLGAAGKKVMDDSIKERNDTIDKINNAAEEALVRGGGLGKNHYDYSFDLVNKFKRDYVTFLYNVAKKTIEDWDEYCDGIHLAISEDDYVEVEQ